MKKNGIKEVIAAILNKHLDEVLKWAIFPTSFILFSSVYKVMVLVFSSFAFALFEVSHFADRNQLFPSLGFEPSMGPEVTCLCSGQCDQM